jgi:DNA-binding transcriptional regulator YbjK
MPLDRPDGSEIPETELRPGEKLPDSLKTYASFRIQYNRNLLKGENKKGPRAVERARERIRLARSIENIFQSMPPSLNTKEEISTYLREQEELWQERDFQASSVAYQKYLGQKTEDIKSAQQMLDNLRDSDFGTAPFKSWDKSSLTAKFDSYFASSINFHIRNTKKKALERGDEAEAYRCDRVHDQLISLANTAQRENLSDEVYAELLANFCEKYDKLSKKTDRTKKTNNLIPLRSAELDFLQLSARVLPESHTQPSASDEFRELDRLLIRLGRREDISEIRNALKQTAPQATQLSWNEPSKLKPVIDDLIGKISPLISTTSADISKSFHENLDSKKTNRDLKTLLEVRYRLELLRSLIEYRIKHIEKLTEDTVADQEFQREEAAGEPWINRNRERAAWRVFEGIKTYLSDPDKNAGDYLHQLLQQAMKKSDQDQIDQLLTSEVRENIELRMVKSEEASSLAKRPIRRPIFVVKDKATYMKVYKAMTGEDGSESHGVHLGGRSLRSVKHWKSIGLILSHDDPGTIEHEIRHSIDPFTSEDVDTRSSYNRLLSELFAYITNNSEILEPGLIDNQLFESIKKQVGNRIYFDSYHPPEFSTSQKNMSFEDWKILVSECVDHLAVLLTNRTAEHAQQVLVQSQTTDQFLATKY